MCFHNGPCVATEWPLSGHCMPTERLLNGRCSAIVELMDAILSFRATRNHLCSDSLVLSLGMPVCYAYIGALTPKLQGTSRTAMRQFLMWMGETVSSGQRFHDIYQNMFRKINCSVHLCLGYQSACRTITCRNHLWVCDRIAMRSNLHFGFEPLLPEPP